MYGYDLDEAGRTLRVYGNSDGELTLYWTNHYDEHGRIDRYEHYTSGVYTFTNTYDGDRLVTVRLDQPEGPAVLTSYRNEDDAAPDIWTHSDTDTEVDGTIETAIERTLVDRRTDTVRITRREVLHHVFTFAYAGDRIDSIERDGGFWETDVPDGTANMRFKWKRDAEGNVTEFTQDGTDSFDAPFVNGTPDFKETFSSGCAPLLRQFPWLAHEPAPNSTAPRFRDDGD